MTRLVMSLAAVVLAVGYALSAVILVYVGFVRRRIRRWYWASVVPCLMLSATQIWLLAEQPTPSNRIIFGQTAACLLVTFRIILPALVVLRDAEGWTDR